MATTKTDICNLALSLLGDERLQFTNVDVSPSTKVTRQCLLHYDLTLDEITRLHTWNCTKKRDELTVTDYTEFGWDKQATLPADCIRPLELEDSDNHYRYLSLNSEWVIEGRTVLSNSSENFLLYQAVPSIANMDGLFLQAFYTILAIKLCIPLTGKRDIRNDLMLELNQVILPEARRVNGFEGYERPVVDSEWLEATMMSGGGLEGWQARSVGDIPM